MSHRRHQHATAAAMPKEWPTTTTPAPIMTDGKTKRSKPLSDDEIRLCAYRKWEAAGKPSGDGVQFWLAAKQELEQAILSTTLEP
jgi:hypothetical protein